MRFLVDECTGPRVAQWLRDQGHDVFSVYEEARGSQDEDLLARALADAWILITNDSDFGELIYRERRRHRGVVFLRLADERVASKIAALQLLLDGHRDRLPDSFVVVTESTVRFGGASIKNQ